MKYRIGFYFFLLLAGCIWCACDDEKIVDNGGVEPETMKDVTYLFYVVGQNNLQTALNKNIEDVKKGLAHSNVNANILAYMDMDTIPTLYLIRKDQNGQVQQSTVKTYPDQYSVDPDVMRSVINDVFSKYPALHNGITFASHANGSLYTSSTVKKRSFGYEGAKGYGMNISDLRAALEGGPYFDVVMFDACLMASVETAYELKGLTHYFLATPNSVPAEGFPYETFMPAVLKMNESGFTDAAKTYMTYFHGNRATWDDFVAVSLSDVTKMDSLALYMDSLFQVPSVQERLQTLDRDQLQSYEADYSLFDYGNWVDSLGRSDVHVAQIRKALDRVVIYKDHSDYASVDSYDRLIIPLSDEKFSGLNTFVPKKNPQSESSQMTFFTTLKWYRDAGFWRASFYSQFAPSTRH